MDQIIALLQPLGLTQYEARAFVTLVHRGLSTAYQVSKGAGIPRARIYDVLDGLVNQGLVMSIPTADDTKTYRAVPRIGWIRSRSRCRTWQPPDQPFR